MRPTYLASIVLVLFTPLGIAEGPPSLEIGPIPPELHVFEEDFDKHIEVFGVHVVASADTPDPKVAHAAMVLAQYLDNDEDGRPDDPAVIAELKRSRAVLIMVNEPDALDRLDFDRFDDHAIQDLYGEETHPEGSHPSRGFDATLEEVLHLISVHGYANAYPEVFGVERGSQLADCCDRARGGSFRRVPRRYPKEAWYHYDDRTCDYECQVTEYFYWALTSLLGAQSYPGRAGQIADEWELPTPDLLQRRDADIHALLSDRRYSMPRRLPDGNYHPRTQR